MKSYRDTSQQFKVSNIAKSERYRNRYPEKVTAQQIAQKIKLDIKCFDCEATERLERHHEDYSKPEEIITLCKMCHYKRHEKKGGIL